MLCSRYQVLLVVAMLVVNGRLYLSDGGGDASGEVSVDGERSAIETRMLPSVCTFFFFYVWLNVVAALSTCF